MNFYSVLSLGYDLLDAIWLKEKGGRNPRKVIEKLVPNENIKVLDLCCGTFSNGFDLAKRKPNIDIMGLDLSDDMLNVGRKKLKKAGISNVTLQCGDATNTGLADGTFDVIILGLVLHEINDELRDGILKECHRLLKEDGSFIVLEWERPRKALQLVKFFPLYVMELLHCKYFDAFYKGSKTKYFMQHDFKMKRRIHCNYTTVCEMVKM